MLAVSFPCSYIRLVILLHILLFDCASFLIIILLSVYVLIMNNIMCSLKIINLKTVY